MIQKSRRIAHQQARRLAYQKALGDTVRKLRNKRHLTQTQLAKLLGYETARQVARMEAGGVPVTLDLIEDLSSALGCGPEPFLAPLFPEPKAAMDSADVEKRLLQLALDNRDREYTRALSRQNVRRVAVATATLPDAQVESVFDHADGLHWRARMESIHATDPPLLSEMVSSTSSKGRKR